MIYTKPAVLFVALGTLVAPLHAGGTLGSTSPACPHTTFYVDVNNMGPDGRTVVLSYGPRVEFAIGSEGSAQVALEGDGQTPEYQVRAYLPGKWDAEMAAKPLCTSWIELPANCSGDVPAAHLTLYKSKNGYHCFIQSVAHLPRYSSDALALNPAADKTIKSH